MKKCIFAILLIILGYSNPVYSSIIEKKKTIQKLTDKERMAWWHEARFGMFIHWGVYSQWAGQYNGHEQERGGAEWILNRCKIPVAEYRQKAKEFNPVNYNPDAWVRMAKNAGMKYIVITSKHHDGFALFDSKASDWDVVDATVYGKDLLKPLAKVCKKHGIKLGFYYSQAQDWVNAGGSLARKLMREGWPNPDSAKIDAYTQKHNGHWDPVQETASFDQYINRVSVPQVREILTNYGDIAVLWWDTPTNMTDSAALKLQSLLSLQPNIITNDRLKRPNFPGDTRTPEQKIPDKDELFGQNWETCMTMNGSWGWRDDNKWKPASLLIQNLLDIASKGGNYLLNIGPKPDGTFPQESIERLEVIGKWMKINGEAIYGTQASPFGLFDWGRCTQKKINEETSYYFSVFTWPENKTLEIPGFIENVVSASILGSNASVATEFIRNKLIIHLPDSPYDKIASVIKVVVK